MNIHEEDEREDVRSSESVDTSEKTDCSVGKMQMPKDAESQWRD